MLHEILLTFKKVVDVVIPSNPAIWGLGQIPLVHPGKILFGGEVQPVVVEVSRSFSMPILRRRRPGPG